MGGQRGQNKEGSHQECTVIVSRIGPVISELCVGVCIIRSVNQSNKRCIYSDSSTWLRLCFIFLCCPHSEPDYIVVVIGIVTKDKSCPLWCAPAAVIFSRHWILEFSCFLRIKLSEII